MYNLNDYLKTYSKIQKNILVCYRPTMKTSWRDRCLYNTKEYEPDKAYNHRSILKDEVVIEFDDDNPKFNEKYARAVTKKFKKDEIKYSMWSSGNKSTHVHALFNFEKASNPSLLKKCIMRYYTKNLPLPDLRLAANNHLIRAEFGVHEKTGRIKKIIERSRDYPQYSRIVPEVWDMYIAEKKKNLQRRLTNDFKDLSNHPKVKYILKSETFRQHEDGRERSLFMLIHVLKPNYVDKKDELVKFLQDWYKYAGGYKISASQIAHKVGYHWKKTYYIGESYVDELFEELGIDWEKVK